MFVSLGEKSSGSSVQSEKQNLAAPRFLFHNMEVMQPTRPVLTFTELSDFIPKLRSASA